MKNLFRIIGILVCLVPMVGFGMCGLFGFTYGVNVLVSQSLNDAIIFLGCGAVGIAISIGLGVGIVSFVKDMRSESTEKGPPHS